MIPLNWKILVLTILLAGEVENRSNWGFYGHKKINRIAVFTLPIEMIDFYKLNITYVTEKAVNPDMRRYVDEKEAARHYIDLDVYRDSALYKMPRYWNTAAELYTEDTLQAYGIVPWHIYTVKNYLTKAFVEQDIQQILRLSADIGHYIADAHVPLHTTSNYNGQETDQRGIHGFWESRLPELFSEEYDFFVGRASYIESPQGEAWKAITSANLALDSVLQAEAKLAERFPLTKKYSYEERGSRTIKVYSYDFSQAYHRKLNGMVERQMKAAVKMIGDFWYTCWVDGGQPDLDLTTLRIEKDTVEVSNAILSEHESGIEIDN
jgi:hypothetical protein